MKSAHMSIETAVSNQNPYLLKTPFARPEIVDLHDASMFPCQSKYPAAQAGCKATKNVTEIKKFFMLNHKILTK